MTITYASGQTANEEHGARSEHLSLTGDFSAGVTLRCAWADRFNVAAAALGSADPQLGLLDVVCLDADITPVPSEGTADGQGIVYEQALVRLKYGMLPGGASETKTDPVSGEDVIVTESLEPTIEYIKLDPRGFRWTDNAGRPVKENEAPSREARGMNIVRAVQNLPSVHSSILTLAGKTNQAEYVSTILGITFPVETLLFIPPSVRRVMKSDGTNVMSIVIKFGYKEKGWNKFWRQDKSGTDKYDTLYDVANSTTYKNFPPADFSNWLF